MSVLRPIDYVGLALGVLAIAVSVLLYFRSKTRLSLSFRSVSLVLIPANAAKDGSLTIEHEGDTVLKGAIGSVLFWNSGNATLTRDDFAPDSRPFIWIVPSDRQPQPPRDGDEAPVILSARVERASHAATAIRTHIHNERELGDHVLLDFDHLAPGDGALVSVLYDQRKPDANLRLSVEGHLRTGRDVTIWKGHKRWDAIVGSSAFALLGLWIALALVNKYLLRTTSDLVPLLVQGAAVLMLFGLLLLRRRFGFGRANRLLSKAYQDRIKQLSTFQSRITEA